MKYLLMFFIVTSLFGNNYSEVSLLVENGNIKRAKALSRLDAIQNTPHAMYNQGILEYALGSQTTAKKWFEKASKAGVVDAKVAEGIMYFEKKAYQKCVNVLKNSHHSLGHDFKSVAQDRLDKTQKASASSYYNVADIFYNDKLVKTQAYLAFELMKIAADKGNAKAQNELGGMYRIRFAGQFQNNITNALHYLNLAQKAGIKEATYHRGMIYIQGPRGVRDIDRGMKLLHVASQAGSLRASAALAEYYYNGLGVSNVAKNSKEAFIYAEKSKKRCSSKQILARMYASGRGTSRDMKKAKKYEKAHKMCLGVKNEDKEYHLPLLAY